MFLTNHFAQVDPTKLQEFIEADLRRFRRETYPMKIMMPMPLSWAWALGNAENNVNESVVKHGFLGNFFSIKKYMDSIGGTQSVRSESPLSSAG